MILQMNGPIRIENLRHYPSETVDRLRSLLLSGASASPNPHRKNFYDLEDGDHAYYIHISPTGAVLLLASWPRDGVHLATFQEALARAVTCADGGAAVCLF